MKRYFLSLITLVLVITCLISCETTTTNSGTKPNSNNKQGGILQAINPTYTVTFETNDGSYVQPITTKTLDKAPTPTKTDYVFDGWFLDENLTTAAIFPLEVKKDTTLYANWLKIREQINFTGGNIKGTITKTNGISYNLEPTGLDLDRLNKLGYRIEINVVYDVKYVKDYDVLFDIGYMGSPKYEVSISTPDGYGPEERDCPTSKKYQTKVISYNVTPNYLQKESLKLKFSTDNIQNKIYFDNISAVFICTK